MGSWLSLDRVRVFEETSRETLRPRVLSELRGEGRDDDRA
jgi:hypothetical protein